MSEVKYSSSPCCPCFSSRIFSRALSSSSKGECRKVPLPGSLNVQHSYKGRPFPSQQALTALSSKAAAGRQCRKAHCSHTVPSQHPAAKRQPGLATAKTTAGRAPAGALYNAREQKAGAGCTVVLIQLPCRGTDPLSACICWWRQGGAAPRRQSCRGVHDIGCCISERDSSLLCPTGQDQQSFAGRPHRPSHDSQSREQSRDQANGRVGRRAGNIAIPVYV